MVDVAASPDTHDMEIRDDNRIWRAPGTQFIEAFAQRQPHVMALHPTLNAAVDLVLVDSPWIGFRNANGDTEWFNVGMADRDEFASTTFGGTFIFTDGIRSWFREGVGAPVEPLEQAPMARTLASFAARVFAGGTLIDGRFEPLGVRWTAANSDYRDWEGFGSGFELLVNDISSGDQIQQMIPMGLDFMAVMMRQSVWVGRFTGQAERPADFSPRATGVGAINRRVSVLSRYGVFFLSDYGVYLFDGNTATLMSEGINAELLPIDYSRLDEYHAVYDPMRKRYILFTPQGITWIFEVEKARWLQRRFTSRAAVLFPTQIDGVRWIDAIGNWAEQGDLIWLDFAPKNLGELGLWMLGDQMDSTGIVRRTLARESRATASYFGVPFVSYWETKLMDEQDSSMLVTSYKQLVEYEGEGCLRIYLPGEDNQYDVVLEAELAFRGYPSTAVFNAPKVGKGTGIGIEFCEEEPEYLPPPEYEYIPGEPSEYEYAPAEYEYVPGEYEPGGDPEVDFAGFVFFSDSHPCAPAGDLHQSTRLELACFIWCDEPECGGLGGWVAWWTNNAEDLALGCASPNNPFSHLL